MVSSVLMLLPGERVRRALAVMSFQNMLRHKALTTLGALKRLDGIMGIHVILIVVLRREVVSTQLADEGPGFRQIFATSLGGTTRRIDRNRTNWLGRARGFGLWWTLPWKRPTLKTELVPHYIGSRSREILRVMRQRTVIGE